MKWSEKAPGKRRLEQRPEGSEGTKSEECSRQNSKCRGLRPISGVVQK